MPTQSNHNNPITFDNFLNSKSIYALQDLLLRWANREYSVHSKIQLIRSLRQEMLNEGRLRAKLDVLPDETVTVLRCIIKGIPCRTGQDRHVRTLIELGFLARWPYTDQNEPRESIPVEIKSLLIEILDIDMRPVEQVISLRNHLGAMPDDQFQQAVAPHVENPEANRETILQALLDKENIARRLDALPDNLRRTVSASVDSSGGLQFLGNEHKIDVSATRDELEANLIGTTTELPITPDGLNYQVVLVFTDVTGELIKEPSEHLEFDEKASTGIEALVDLITILQHLAIEGVRVKQGGDFYKSSLKRIDRLIGDIDSNVGEPLSDFYLDLLQDLGLAHEELGILVPAKAHDIWLQNPPERQLQDILDILPESAFLEHYLWQTILAVLKKLPVETPVPRSTMNSHLLLAFLQHVGAGQDLGRDLYRFRDYNAVFSSACAYVQILETFGIVDRFLADGQFVGFQVTDLGAHVLEMEPSEPSQAAAAEKILIINPDFECIVFRHGPAWRVAAALGRFAIKEKAEPTAYHFKIDKDEVEAAVLSGMTGEQMVTFLKENSRTPVPQNISYSITDWAGRVHVVHTFPAILLEAQERETLDMIMQDAEFHPYIKRRLGDTVLMLTERITDKKLLDRLRQLGIFVQTA